MTREARIIAEDTDYDVCYGDYDGHVTRPAYCVEFYSFGMLAGVSNWFTSEAPALMQKGLWESGEGYKGEYGEVKFDFAFRDEVMALLVEDL